MPATSNNEHWHPQNTTQAIPREAVMVFGGEHDVLEPGQFGEGSPFLRLEAVGIELAGEDAKEALDVIGGRPHQRMGDDAAEWAVDRPVNEQAQAAVAEQFDGGRVVAAARRRRLGEDGE